MKNNNSLLRARSSRSIKIAALAVLALSVLTGCSSLENKLESFVLEKSGIKETEEYKQYEALQNESKIDQEGYYIFSDEDVEVTSGSVHITFGENLYLDVSYFLDEECTKRVDTNKCYLNPGDKLYVQVQSNNKNSNLYHLSEFRIREYEKNGLKEKKVAPDDNSLIYQIPTDFSGELISILPVGQYDQREITFKVYYLNADKQETPLSSAGEWTINDKPCASENTGRVSPVEPYSLKYTFDKEHYFFVSSSPKCFTPDPQLTGFVEFYEQDPMQATPEYSIELHEYLSLRLILSEKGTITINGEDQKRVAKNKEIELSSTLKYGDELILETSGECLITTGDYNHITAKRDPIGDQYRYKLTITEDTNNSIIVSPCEGLSVNHDMKVSFEPSCKYGSCEYKIDGVSISSFTDVPVKEGQTLEITYTITNKEYAFSEKNPGIGGFIKNLLKPNERTYTRTISIDMDNTTIKADDYFDIVKKGN